MTTIVFLVIYAAVLVFCVASAARAVAYARFPLHLRWELYPVPHEDPEKLKHGGSRYEDLDHWQKKSKFNLWGELSFMVPEMLFLKALHEFNRKLWNRSFPFHFGLYLLIGTIALLVCAALSRIAGMDGLSAGLGVAATATGIAGMALAIVGAIGLLLRRARDPELVNYAAPGDIFNLVFFLVALGLITAGYLLAGPDFPGAVAFTAALLQFDASLSVPGLLAAGLILGSLLAAYIPMTHMSHFVAKYFTYHSIRWDDAAIEKGGPVERRLAEYLTYRPHWSAAHVGADGKKTWADIATTNPAQKGDKK